MTKQIHNSLAVDDNSRALKFDNFSEFQNVISDSSPPLPLPRPQPQRYYDALRTKIDMWLSTKRKVIEDYWKNCKISRDDLAIQIEQKYHPNIGQLLICYAFDFKKWICDVFDYKIIKKSLTKFCRLLKDKCCLWETSQNSKIFFQGKLTFFYSHSTRELLVNVYEKRTQLFYKLNEQTWNDQHYAIYQSLHCRGKNATGDVPFKQQSKKMFENFPGMTSITANTLNKPLIKHAINIWLNFAFLFLPICCNYNSYKSFDQHFSVSTYLKKVV